MNQQFLYVISLIVVSYSTFFAHAGQPCIAKPQSPIQMLVVGNEGGTLDQKEPHKGLQHVEEKILL